MFSCNGRFYLKSNQPKKAGDYISTLLRLFPNDQVALNLQKRLESIKLRDLQKCRNHQKKQTKVCAKLISQNTFGAFELEMISVFSDWDVPCLIIHNKHDLEPLSEDTRAVIQKTTQKEALSFSTLNSVHLH